MEIADNGNQLAAFSSVEANFERLLCRWRIQGWAIAGSGFYATAIAQDWSFQSRSVKESH